MILSSVRNPDNANIMVLTQKVYQSPKYSVLRGASIPYDMDGLVVMSTSTTAT